MGMSLYARNAVLENIFKKTALPFDADTTWYVNLHTADPGDTNTQESNQVSYSGYTRMPIDRNSTDFSVDGDGASNLISIAFPVLPSGGPIVITHVSIGREPSSDGDIIWIGELSPPLTVNDFGIPTASISGLLFSMPQET